MSLSIGIIGMPNVGKSTLFNALTQAGAEASSYPFCTVDKNVGVTVVPDEKLMRLNEILKPKECVPTTIQFIDIAGLVRGASQGEGLGNKFLGHIRDVDSVVHVVRCFADERVAHVDGNVDPVRDIEVVEIELALADLESVERIVTRLKKTHSSDPKTPTEELNLMLLIKEGLEKGIPARKLRLSKEQTDPIKGYNLLSLKPTMYIANVDEDEAATETEKIRQIKDLVGAEKVLVISAKIEEEIAELPESERKDFLASIGLQESGLTRLIKAGYKLLDLVTFYTVANNKLRAWQVVEGTLAPEAAGKIHSDMEKGFIRAEVAHYDDLEKSGSWTDLHKHGLIRTEGRTYQIQEGDVVYFLFNP